MSNLITHMRTDPNAPKHQIMGAMACVAGLAACGWQAALLAPLFAGVGIELIQRVQRIGKTQNTAGESVLDALVTGLWWIAPLGWRK